MNAQGTLRTLLYRIPPCMLIFPESAYRIVPEVLTSPVMGTYLPNNLQEIADVFTEGVTHKFSRDRLQFAGYGNRYYGPACTVEILQAVQ